MKTDLFAIEPNRYRREAMREVIGNTDFTYNRQWHPDKVSWIVMGQFTLNDETWLAPEYADDECLRDTEYSKYLYESIDKALLTRLFSLKRIERKLAGVI